MFLNEASFSFIFGLTQTNNVIFKQINVKNIQYGDSNSQPFDYESPPINHLSWAITALLVVTADSKHFVILTNFRNGETNGPAAEPELDGSRFRYRFQRAPIANKLDRLTVK